MREAVIICGGLPAPKMQQVVELDVSHDAPESRRIAFDTTKFCAPLVDDLPDVLADALELGAYVFCADRLIKRGGADASRGIGSEWQRHLKFRIPVRCPEVWDRPDVRSALVDALSFLSGDRFTFEFSAASAPMSLEPFLGFGDRKAQVIRPDKVMLFSGGLDSLAGVARDVIGAGQRAVLVTHQSANAIIDLQDQLSSQIERRTAERQIFYLPVRLRRGHDQPCEHSQRLRSFLFASLGMAYARMFGLNTVDFYENGITSFNLPVSEHVIGTRASRTTHPQVLASYAKLYSLLLGEPVAFANSFLWHTKADVVRMIVDHGCGDLIRLTTSCASVREYSMTREQCGICSQCVERRVAMIAAEAEHLEEPYGRDVFLGPIKEPTALTMIGGHLLRARRLASMSKHAFLSNHGQVFRAFQAIGGSAAGAAEQTYVLHRRYGQEFVKTVEGQLSRNATIDGMRNIQTQSLLGMLQNRSIAHKPYMDPTEREDPASIQKAVSPEVPLRTIVLAVNCQKKQVEFADGPVLRGKAYAIIEALVEHRDASAASGTPLADCPFLQSRKLAARIKSEDDPLRKLVSRLRKQLTDQYEASTGFPLDQEDLVQTRHWQGYRLNPHVVVTPPHSLVRREQMSRNSAPHVTSTPSLS